MAKTYYNDALVGNSRMLGCLTERGELVRLFWPNIDYPQHIDKMAVGVFLADGGNGTVWLNESTWRHRQHYIADTNILDTTYESVSMGLKIVQTDFALPGRDILIRHYRIENRSDYEKEIGFIVYSSCISQAHDLWSTLFDFVTDSLVHYRHGYYMSISADRESYQFQLGNNAFDCAKCAQLTGYDSIGMVREGAVSWKLGSLKCGEEKTFTLYICLSKTLKEIKTMTRDLRNIDALLELKRAENYWRDYIRAARYTNLLERMTFTKASSIGKEEISALYKRSLLVFKLMSDEKTGGILAAPEIDEEFTRCGRYAYCWGRDAAFITGALDKCGLSDMAGKFFDWAENTQDESGAWYQRYHMDGNLAPSWGLQIDETGTLVWGMLQHYRVTRDRGFLLKMWDCIEKAVEFLIGFIDKETGLPGLSYDLWEERLGEHVYSSAAVYAGIKAGAEIADILNHESSLIERWQTAADGIRRSVEMVFWREKLGRFIRSIRVKMNPWGNEYSPERIMVRVNPKGFFRDVTAEDDTLDVSVLGVAIPFGMFDAYDFRVKNTVKAIESKLASSPAGGIKRYENDCYIGGNPWIIATLWMALYHIRIENYSKAREYLEWAVKARTDLGFLPEQVNKDTGKAAWVIPLTWSHAMFVLVLIGLLEAGEL